MTYDKLNRVSSALASSGPWGPANGQLGLTLNWSYDVFGNREAQTPSGNPSTAVPPVQTLTYTGGNNNRVDNYGSTGYDLAGNVTYDLTNHYAYDAEGRLCAVSNPDQGSMQYIYDAEGRRVAKGTISSLSCARSSNGFSLTETYVLGQSGEHVSELGSSGNFLRSHVYANGQLLATYSSSGTEFSFSDWLGSKRLVADADGKVAGTCINLPFGDELICSTSVPLTGHHFTGQIHDPESLNDYFGARYYSNYSGRFMSPDFNESGDDLDPVPYARLENPQSLNLYSYVQNNPLSRRDANGHVQLCGPSTTSTNANRDTVVNANCTDLPDIPTIRQTIRQAVYQATTTAPRGQQVPQMSQNNANRFDPLSLFYGVGGTLSVKAKDTLDKLRGGEPLPEGQKAGGKFNNDGSQGAEELPKTDANGNPISYKEYDVEPTPSGGRSGERIVRGSDGSDYYTSDHYQHFEKVP